MNAIQQEVRSLIKQLSEYQKSYYVDSRPQVSDLEYDRLFDRLQQLEKDHPEFSYPDSPTRRVGSDLDADFPEVAHTIPVLSLDKSYTAEQLLAWIEKTESKLDEQVGIVIEEKIDGISIVLYYEEGVLRRAVTRGNGAIGNDVTDNVRTIASVPLRIPTNQTLAVRGEVYLPKASFAQLNEQLEVPFANPRNLAAGTIRRVKSSQVAKVPLQMFVYEGFWESDDQMKDHLSILSALSSYGFRINENLAYFTQDATMAKQKLKEANLNGFAGSFGDIASYLDTHTKRRKDLPYEIDGLVAKVDELSFRELLGYTEHHPRWAMAYKFESPQAQTEVLAIDVQVGRTGRVTPVARVRPVQVAGSTISNITLHNQDYINMLELGIGDSVEISRRGDVIPAVERVIEKAEGGEGTYHMPTTCPVCSTVLVQKGAHTFCPNPNCPQQVKGRIEFFIGKDGMDIENFGPETAAVLIDRGLVTDVDDLYRLDYRKALGEQSGFGEKKIRLIEDGIQKSLKKPFRKVLVALGIPELGKKGADILVNAGLDSMEKLLNVAREQDIQRLVSIKQIGEKSAQLYIDAFNDAAMIRRIDSLASLGLSMEEQQQEDAPYEQSFAGQVWCVTGSFEHFNPRTLALEEVEKRGGRTVSSVTGKTTHLLAGSGAGSKLEAAKKLGVTVIDEQMFLSLLEGGAPNRDERQGEFSF
ncbi:MAG: NAD-dependent DNA ligase LigA [Sphaerochaeta sp.]|jgi:DNA ligase (NAD+)|nr:NAD-dependent DNA ligase LigA [Sphaerochaeta sp.]